MSGRSESQLYSLFHAQAFLAVPFSGGLVAELGCLGFEFHVVHVATADGDTIAATEYACFWCLCGSFPNGAHAHWGKSQSYSSLVSHFLGNLVLGNLGSQQNAFGPSFWRKST